MLSASTPGPIMLVPGANVENSPPFFVGDSFSYVCEDTNVYQLTPPSNEVTRCEESGLFTYDVNPPTCQQICESK